MICHCFLNRTEFGCWLFKEFLTSQNDSVHYTNGKGQRNFGNQQLRSLEKNTRSIEIGDYYFHITCSKDSGIIQSTKCKKKGHNLIIRLILIAALCLILLTVGLEAGVTQNNSFGADFSIYWQAARALFLNGTNPYAESTTDLIQWGIYGHLAYNNQDQLRYAYPPFSLLIVLPTIFMSFSWAQAYWMAFNILLIFFAIALVWKRQSLWILVGLPFFYPVSRGFILGQFALMIGALLIVAYKLTRVDGRRGNLYQFIAGVLLAWCSMKPHLIALVLLFFMLKAVRDHHWRLIQGYIAGLIVFATISFIMDSTWLADWFNLIKNYIGYMPDRPIIASWLSSIHGDWSSLGVKILFTCVAVIISTFAITRWWKSKYRDYFLLGWLVLIGQLVNPNTNSLLSDQILFLLPLSLWLMDRGTPGWIRGCVWALFISIPWALFLFFSRGSEPYIVSSGLAGLYCLWLLGIWFHHWVDKRRLSLAIGLPPQDELILGKNKIG